MWPTNARKKEATVCVVVDVCVCDTYICKMIHFKSMIKHSVSRIIIIIKTKTAKKKQQQASFDTILVAPFFSAAKLKQPYLAFFLVKITVISAGECIGQWIE